MSGWEAALVGYALAERQDKVCVSVCVFVYAYMNVLGPDVNG